MLNSLRFPRKLSTLSHSLIVVHVALLSIEKVFIKCSAAMVFCFVVFKIGCTQKSRWSYILHIAKAMEAAEISCTLAVLPGYSHLFSENRITGPAFCQILVCFGAIVCYLILAQKYNCNDKSWGRAIQVLRTVRDKVKRLEKQRDNWRECLDMTEEACRQYYALLHYVTKRSVDVSKLASNLDIESTTSLDASTAAETCPSLASDMSDFSLKEVVEVPESDEPETVEPVEVVEPEDDFLTDVLGPELLESSAWWIWQNKESSH